MQNHGKHMNMNQTNFKNNICLTVRKRIHKKLHNAIKILKLIGIRMN